MSSKEGTDPGDSTEGTDISDINTVLNQVPCKGMEVSQFLGISKKYRKEEAQYTGHDRVPVENKTRMIP